MKKNENTLNESQYPIDKLLEAEFGRFLDERFYINFFQYLSSKEGGSFDFLRNRENAELQKLGQDMSLRHSNYNKLIIIDEKAQFNYANKFNANNEPLLPTFAFELRNFNSGNIGWFINDDNISSRYYLFRKIVTKSRKSNSKSCLLNDIKNGEVEKFIFDIVHVERFKKFLALIGLTDEVLWNLSTSNDCLEASTYDGKVQPNKYVINKLPKNLKYSIYITDSPDISEKPRNLVVNIDKLYSPSKQPKELHDFLKGCKFMIQTYEVEFLQNQVKLNEIVI